MLLFWCKKRDDAAGAFDDNGDDTYQVYVTYLIPVFEFAVPFQTSRVCNRVHVLRNVLVNSNRRTVTIVVCWIVV